MDYTPEDRWIRRGHTHKPNGIVRGIYWISDWFGDFGPMVSKVKHTIVSTGLILVNLIILIGVLISSAAHSLQLLRHAGASHGIEYVLLVVFELLFLFSSLLLDQAFKLGIASIKKSWHVWLPFLIGLVFVLCSNIVGMSPNAYVSVIIRAYSGLVIGAITPVLLLSSKWMLYWQVNIRAEYERKRRFEKAAEERNKKSEEISDKTAYGDIARLLQREKETGEKVGEKTGEQAGEKEEDETAVEPLKHQQFANIETDEKHQEDSGEETGENVGESGQEKREEIGDGQPAEQPIEIENIPPKRAARIIQTAKKWKLEKGRLPGRVNLSKYAKCSEHEARKILKWLKQTG